MKITDLLIKQAMILDLQATDKASAIDEMVDKLYEAGRITDKEVFKTGILNREAQTSTGLGEGIAMPHAKNEAVKEATILFAKSKAGIDYEALDGQPVYVFFMIAAPAGANDTHLKALASLSQYLMKPGFIDKLRATETPDQVIALFEAEEKEVAQPEPAPEIKSDKYLVAVTACTTGIAHTYMAEEALKKKAAELGINIKVETNGASGVGNRLTAADIAKADGVIVAADKAVEMERFAGKHLVNRPVADGIRKTEELIDLAISGKAPIFEGSGENSESEDEAAVGLGKKFYKHLMSGVSQMLPFVIGGGILIAIAFLIDNAMGVPKDQLSQLGSYNELAAWFKNVGSAAFAFMLPILSGYIAYSIAEKPGLVSGFVAGSIASSGLAFGKVPFASGGEDTLALAGVPSGFLGALVGGFLAGGVLILLKKIFANVPRSLNGIVSILVYPVLGVFLTGFLMLFVNIPMAAINTGLNNFLESLSGTSAVLMGLVLGGMMAIDMGGPVNKAAYIFGTGTLAASISTGGSVVMAAVMAGGMVPPLAIFVATLLFKDKFNKEQQDAGLTNIVMGLSFITEGAIPFAASDPARAIPSFVIGSALSGGLVGLFGIKLLAPHGGIFVIALTTNPLLYIVSVVIGAIVSGVILGLLKKAPVTK
ncbi:MULTISPECIES: fructose-specific PTS transporter subunit EIIC [unclassified Enterococcus]|uniref:PTS fructose transporter subunit IIABC n=1 Tax=unclassified Enterococcus TaxID=2608891 RepID=UPI00155742F8|nr:MULTISPECIES: fructose-specific PTS transporter subunit EIIC [unclassified Enterococcus]MBS7576705.1 fructose-specific PTS transporter subunit EIIC [Enterococcus sp. MMGLQ5-2]MBS7583808.1 fructose-specific PTS transporter subunit EIIC [Enterococcus sp. MMGLQ5-1]NPD11669.1 PTS transporter subunit EIIA [Enterococcus sp. MMGLQ5-1]NPD36542.1 PTS transporter subunit EIIA [Enterococcus sp. MMGLQ5-2]